MNLPITLALFKRSTAASLVSAALLTMFVTPYYSHTGGFLQGTLVRMGDGLFKQIQQIKENKDDYCDVVSLEMIEPQKDLSSVFCSRNVVEVKEHLIASHVEIVVGGETIHAAPDQKFLLFPQGGWIKACDLIAGTHLWSYYGDVRVEKVNRNDHTYSGSPRHLLYRCAAFELSLQRTHTYFVGTQMLLVHNVDSGIFYFNSITQYFFKAAATSSDLLAAGAPRAACTYTFSTVYIKPAASAVTTVAFPYAKALVAAAVILGIGFKFYWDGKRKEKEAEEKHIFGKDPGPDSEALVHQYCYAKELAPNELRAALPFPFTDPFGRYRYASTYGGLLFNNKKHSDLVGMFRDCYTRRYLPDVGSKAFDECGNLWEFREGGILRASRGGKLILEAEPISHPGVLCATTGGKQEYLIRFNHDFVKDPRIAVAPKSGLVRRPLTYSQNALLEDEAGYATSYYNDLLHQVTQCEEPLGPITASSPAVPTNQVAQELKCQADTLSSAASIPQQEDALAFSQAIPADQIVQEEGRQATNVLIAPPISQSERLAASTQSTSTNQVAQVAQEVKRQAATFTPPVFLPIPQQEEVLAPEKEAEKKELEDFYWEVVQINAAGRLKIRAVLVADKESFYSAWGEIDELGNFVGEQVLYDNGDIRIRLDGIDVFYHANNDDSGDDNAKTNDAEGDKENKGKGDPNKPPKGPKDDKLGPKAVPPVDRRRKTLDDEKSTPILKRGLTWVRNNCEKMETVVNNKTEEKLGLENVKYLFKLWGFGEVTVIQMIFAATVLTLGSVYAFYNTWKNQALEKKIDILLEQNLALKGRLEELFVTLEQRRIDAQPAFGPSGN